MKLISEEQIYLAVGGNKELLKQFGNPKVCDEFKAIALTQLEADQEKVKEILRIIAEDFVEIVSNFYMGDENCHRAITLWQAVKKHIEQKYLEN